VTDTLDLDNCAGVSRMSINTRVYVY